MVLDYSFGTASFVMPNVLAKLGAEVLVVNPYAATAGGHGQRPRAAAGHVADLVRASGAHLGAVIDPGGEHITLVDDEGQVLYRRRGAPAAARPGGLPGPPDAKVALPVSAPMAAEHICAAAGAEIVWTKLSATHLMEVASTGGVTFAASQKGGLIFPAFLPAFDAVATLVHLLGMLARTGERLSKLASRLPPVHIAHEEVVTPWEQKGTVMRTTVERAKGRDVVLVDGVKLPEADGWALVVPDPEEPVTHVWAEAPSEAEARGPGPGASRPHPPDDAVTHGAEPSRPGRPRGPFRYGPGHARARRSSLHRRPRVGPARRRHGAGRYHRLRPGRAR